MGRWLSRLKRDRDGVSAVEFAMIAPLLLLTLLGLFDLAHNMYTSSMLQGAIQQAARNSTIEGAAGSSAALDGIVTRAVTRIAPGAKLTFSRKAYTNFADVSRPEDFTDVNSDGSCNLGEPFEDVNGNGSWDADRGTDGFGGARDAVLYKVTVTYPRAFPIARLMPGQSDTMTISSATVLRNQPYSLQESGAPKIGACT